MLLHLQHVMVADELRLQSSKGFPCLTSLLRAPQADVRPVVPPLLLVPDMSASRQHFCVSVLIGAMRSCMLSCHAVSIQQAAVKRTQGLQSLTALKLQTYSAHHGWQACKPNIDKQQICQCCGLRSWA